MTQIADLRRVSIMLSGTIEYLIDVLDYLHGDPEFEPETLEDGDEDRDIVRPRERDRVRPRIVRRRV